jgi:hypothetical protein
MTYLTSTAVIKYYLINFVQLVKSLYHFKEYESWLSFSQKSITCFRPEDFRSGLYRPKIFPDRTFNILCNATKK